MRSQYGILAAPLTKLLGIVVATTLLAACEKPQETEVAAVVRPVKTLVLEGSSKLIREYPGKVRAAERVELSFEVPGALIELPARQGQNFAPGELLAKLNQRDYQSTLGAAQAEYEKQEANFKRAEELVKKDFISKTDYDRIKAARDVAKADLEKATKALEDTEMRAPFDGVVARRYVENFTDVQAKQPILSFQDNSNLELLVDAPERLVVRRADISQLKLTARFESVPGREFDLSVKEFATEADPNTQTFEYVLLMPRPEGANILPGMTAIVSGQRMPETEEPAKTTFLIPAIAVFADNAGASQVWVVDRQTNQVHRRAVETGNLAGTDSIEVTGGLEAGEMIAISGVSQLREGQEVRPVDRIRY